MLFYQNKLVSSIQKISWSKVPLTVNWQSREESEWGGKHDPKQCMLWMVIYFFCWKVQEKFWSNYTAGKFKCKVVEKIIFNQKT